MSIKRRFQLILFAAAAGLLVLAGFWLHGERSALLSQKQEKARNLVEIPYSVVVKFHQLEANQQLSRAEAQQRALEVIRPMRYEGSNYFWINDLHPAMVMHPMKPEIEGKDLSDYHDPAGKALFIEMAKTVRQDGAGFVSYLWVKPGRANDAPVAKLSFVKGFEPWGWVLGTGIYIDDMDAAWRKVAWTGGGIALVCLMLMLVICTSLSRSLPPVGSGRVPSPGRSSGRRRSQQATGTQRRWWVGRGCAVVQHLYGQAPGPATTGRKPALWVVGGYRS